MLRGNSSYVMGKMIILEGLILLAPLFTIVFYWNNLKYAYMFIVPVIISTIIGILLLKFVKLRLRSSQMVVISWIYGFAIASVPFIIYGISPLHSIFESVSGFTTTGLSVLDPDKLPKIFLFYRGFLQYVGGLGFVIMMLLFVQEKDSALLYEAEGHPDKLMPTIGKTAKVIALMYGIFLIIGVILYRIFGMDVFDGIVHTMCALSTGGFSNKLDSIGYYHSLPIEWITIVLMLIGTTNFSLLLLLCKGKFKRFFKASEIRFMFGLIIIIIPIMTVFLNEKSGSLGKNLESSFFNAVSAMSTTGYSTSDYSKWSQGAIGIMVILMLIGGGVGSTAGGIKLGRVCRILKNLMSNIRKKIIPERRVILTYYHNGNEKELLDQDKVSEASTYFETYIIIFIVGSLALTYFSKVSLLNGSFEFASSLGTVGLSIGVTNPQAPAISLIIEIVGMILGRLEIFVIIQALIKNRNIL